MACTQPHCLSTSRLLAGDAHAQVCGHFAGDAYGVTVSVCPSSDRSALLFLTKTWSPPQRKLHSRSLRLNLPTPLPSTALSGGDASTVVSLLSGAPRHTHHVRLIRASSSRPIMLWAPFHRWGS